jgi:hypothetical protein
MLVSSPVALGTLVAAAWLGVACAAPAQVSGPPAPVGDFQPIRQGAPDELDHMEPFFEGASYDEELPTPDAILGQRHGSRLSHHDEILACFRAWQGLSPRLDLAGFGMTYEGRELVRAVITSPANLERLDEIRADLGRLADPRGLSEAEAEAILGRTPPVAWMGYSIHGDELSGSDAAVALGYHLLACTDEDVSELLDEIVVVIDPCLNPDGRERIIGMVEQGTGYVPTLDYASMARGRWPWGRGNHYLFDMNRDWMSGVNPETRARWREARSFHPQLFIDAHEMGDLDTYLFYPQSQPHNPLLPERLDAWHQVFGADQAAAFDRQGWPYYTREWADGWAPFYSDSWGSLRGAVGILYEQAGTAGVPLRGPEGRVRTYREAVHRQAVSSLANLKTLADNRDAILADYLAHKRANVAADTPGNDRMLVVVPGRNFSRERALLSMLLGQGIEVWRTTDELSVTGVETALGHGDGDRTIPVGSLLVPARQPLGPMVKCFLSFDVRMQEDFLREEREELEREGDSKIYDVTAWSVPLHFDLDALWCDALEPQGELMTAAEAPVGGLAEADGDEPAFGWVVDGADDASVAFAARALEAGLAVHLADKSFTTGGRTFPRGSLLVRRGDNEDDVEQRVARAAEGAGVLAHTTVSGRSPDEGPDLGGGHFTLLARPRVAMLSNAPVAPDAFGHLWFHLDHEVETWVRGGGTLIACGGAASAVLGKDKGLSSVVRRRDVLDDLDGWLFAAERERRARDVEIDLDELWGKPPAEEAVADEELPAEEGDGNGDEGDEPEAGKEKDSDGDPDKKRQDAWMRRFAPRGAIARGLVDEKAWITVGCGSELPVTVDGSSVYLSREPVRTAVRLAPAERLRLSGLLWPEARQRLADSAWLTVERAGAGQVILFAVTPGYRGQYRSGARLFANAVVYGPGAGASQPVGW